MLDSPGAIAVAGVCAFGGILIAIGQVRRRGEGAPAAAAQRRTRAGGFAAAVRCVLPLAARTQTRLTLSHPHRQILCHLRNYTEPVLQVRPRRTAPCAALLRGAALSSIDPAPSSS